VLTGEVGEGTVNVLIKTQFNSTCLLPSNATKLSSKGYVGNETEVAFFSNSTNLTSAVLTYTTDSWNSTKQIHMKITNQTCSAAVPTQKAGTQVNYQVNASDTLMNDLYTEGNFTVKQLVTINITTTQKTALVGENFTIQGTVTGISRNTTVTVQVMNAKETHDYQPTVTQKATFTISSPANATGTWFMQATFAGDDTAYSAYSNQLMVTVEAQPFLAKNGMFIGGGGFFGVVALALFYYIKKRRQ
jgi:hypothetical protein